MPRVYTDDVRKMFADAKSKFKKENSRQGGNWNERLFKELSDDLALTVTEYNRSENKYKQLRTIAHNTLYRKIHYDLRNDSIGEDCSYDLNTLDVLCWYSYERLYSERFIILDKNIKELETDSNGERKKPLYAEFPIGEPSVPATPTVRIEVPGLNNVFIKREDQNYTGTHKDRMAYEIASFYPEYVRTIKQDVAIPGNPVFSLITSGCAGIAIQSLFRVSRFPNLKVLLNSNIDIKIEEALKNIGCEVYKTNLADKALTTEDVLRLTDNDDGDGFDLTFTKQIEHVKLKYYDWLSYEIINENPDYCFVPFGSGDLMINLLKTINAELKISFDKSDKRLQVDIQRFVKTGIYGATTKNPNTRMDKLYSPFFSENDNRTEVTRLVNNNIVKEGSEIYAVDEEKYLNEALEIAKANNINCEPSGIAGLALLLQRKEKMLAEDPDFAEKKILIVNTGRLRLDLFETKEKAEEYIKGLRRKVSRRNSFR